MPGPIEYNKNHYPPLSDIAYIDDNGRWRAARTDYGYNKDQFIATRTLERPNGVKVEKPAGDIGRAYTMRQHANHVKTVMDRKDMSESEAREWIAEKEQEIEQVINNDAPPEEIIDIRRQLRGS